MNGWLGAGLILGVILVVWYLILVAKHKRQADVLKALRLFLAAVLVQAGVKLAYLIVTTSEARLEPFHGEDRFYIAIGAGVMIWLACADCYRELSSVPLPPKGADAAGCSPGGG
ncbi:MAG: hypothetical protein ACJ760_14320 [Thermoleophilaceae bacterium]